MLALGIISLIGGIILSLVGNGMNNDLSVQLDSLMSSGKINPGDLLFYIGIVIAALGLIFLIIGAVKKFK